MNLLALDFNAHGIPNGKPDQFYADLLAGPLKGYSAIGRDSVETVYFRGMILRVLRAIDFLAAQPEWDGQVLIVQGSSQGGGQALVAAGLDPRVTLCLASVPAMCDHAGYKLGRQPGWPRIVPKVEGQYDENVTQVARYVDAANFATRIKCPTHVTVGFVDHVCAPASVYAAFNAIPVEEKHITPRAAMGHTFPKDLQSHFDDVLRQHIEQVKGSGSKY
jgi:cephalosporin-C deacetylase